MSSVPASRCSREASDAENMGTVAEHPAETGGSYRTFIAGAADSVFMLETGQPVLAVTGSTSSHANGSGRTGFAAVARAEYQ